MTRGKRQSFDFENKVEILTSDFRWKSEPADT